MVLKGDWATRIKAGAAITEVVAAHVAYNEAHCTSYEVVFEPDGSLFSIKESGDIALIGSTSSSAAPSLVACASAALC